MTCLSVFPVPRIEIYNTAISINKKSGINGTVLSKHKYKTFKFQMKCKIEIFISINKILRWEPWYHSNLTNQVIRTSKLQEKRYACVIQSKLASFSNELVSCIIRKKQLICIPKIKRFEKSYYSKKDNFFLNKVMFLLSTFVTKLDIHNVSTTLSVSVHVFWHRSWKNRVRMHVTKHPLPIFATKHPLPIFAMRNTRNRLQSSEVAIVLVPHPQNHLENTKQTQYITLEHA